jgi:hypothetical protein
MTIRPKPEGFITTEQAAKLRGFTTRTARNRAINHAIGLKVSRPMGGVEWLIHEDGLSALQVDDTGGIVDAQRYVQMLQQTDDYSV